MVDSAAQLSKPVIPPVRSLETVMNSRERGLGVQDLNSSAADEYKPGWGEKAKRWQLYRHAIIFGA